MSGSAPATGDTITSPGGNVTPGPNTFRTNFPAFADTAVYPDSAIIMYLSEAADSLGPQAIQWGQWLYQGEQLYAAHFLALDRREDLVAQAGGVPGNAGGVVASKTVGKASISYDTQVGLDPAGGQWNLTIYGRRLYRFIRLVGMGGVQVAGLTPQPGVIGYPAGYVGPLPQA